MITRIEIDGFKSFMDFSLDLPPFLAIVGRNTSGKSNLLDALAFVAAVGRGERLSDAVRLARGTPASLFHRHADGTPAERMTFAVEFLLDRRDLWSPDSQLGDGPLVLSQESGTRWRYECELGWKERHEHRALDVRRETLVALDAAEDRWPDHYPMADVWRTESVRYEPLSDDGKRVRLNGLRSGHRVRREISGRVVQGDFIGIAAQMACLLEFGRLRVLRLEPEDIAAPSPLEIDMTMSGTGAGLAGWLQNRVDTPDSEDNPPGVLRDVSMGLGRVIRDVITVRLVPDEERGDVRLRYELRNDRELEAPQASDGTLRVTAMLAALHDPNRRGLVAIEEPENGVFPDRFGDLMSIIRASATDMEHDDPDWPLQQTLVTSHSPLLLDAVPRESVVFLETVSRVENGTVSRVTVPRRLLAPGEQLVRREDEIPPMSETELKEFRSPIAGPT